MSTNNSTNVPKKKRVREPFTSDQVVKLEEEFRKNDFIKMPRRRELSIELGTKEEKILMWFQNRRRKERNLRKLHLPFAGGNGSKRTLNTTLNNTQHTTVDYAQPQSQPASTHTPFTSSSSSSENPFYRQNMINIGQVSNVSSNQNNYGMASSNWYNHQQQYLMQQNQLCQQIPQQNNHLYEHQQNYQTYHQNYTHNYNPHYQTHHQNYSYFYNPHYQTHNQNFAYNYNTPYSKEESHCYPTAPAGNSQESHGYPTAPAGN
ncbi:Segmentation protein even-skipped [Armadillidium nasatum]|uniref:Segmentation protein even-skipped n=1 Tax=Armadillidium nasatum TaxID=96803 RepID=A0A5N5SPH6_9CRUS|nr:Segmentation protein even-skipped [Armadillidium nasatum]